ncbi:MAG: restriction endonuclease subunit S, partial [Planktothrix sp.]|uniref:restriction endonuclease subunit S n=1 Tax=Planktothrix sp. TaxID=3088171 RepID=UPI0038D4F405
MSEWREVYLNEAYSICSGISKPAKDFGSGFPFLSFKDVFNNFFIPEKLSELVESTDKERESFSIKRGDVFLTRTSETVKELGMSCVSLKDYENATFNGFTKRLRPNNNFVIVPEYAGYYFRTSKFRSEVTAMSSASTRASLNNEMLGRLKIILPSEKEQKQIAAVLFCLDNKIDNLRRQNETLEKIAQTLFKHWFIDFEFPNDDGKPYKSSGGAMVASELGDIPEGWHVACLDEYVNVINGYSYKGTELLESDTALINLKNFDRNGGFKVDGFKSLKTDNYKKQHIVCPNDLIVAHTDLTQNAEVLGNAALVQPSDKYKKYILSMDLVKLESKKDFLNNFFFYYLLSTREFKGHCIGYSNGTTVLHLSKKAIPEYIFPVSNEIDIIIKFQNIASILRNKITNNIQQIQTLIKTRDALLPKLMSG